jgi:N-acyl-D-aspartate/D-glutamate deacylase
MLDVLIRGGSVVDGTGAARRRADVAIEDGRIVAIGAIGDAARRVIDADGRIVAPGFVDIHTHLDVQGFWDTTLSPSPLHGVTTVLGGNCGFTVAPLTDADAGYLMRMLARVEGMPLSALERGVPWSWRTTGEYLDALEGRLAVNSGFMVGHSTIRRVVMGEEATARVATADELAAMAALLREGLAAGGLGFSSTSSQAHVDADGNLVPSCHAAPGELVHLAGVCRDFPGTSLEYLPFAGVAPSFPQDKVELMARMSVAAQRPLNWNVLLVTAGNEDEVSQKLSASDYAAERGGKVVGLHMPKPIEARVNFRSGTTLQQLPGWKETMTLDPVEKLAQLRDPRHRARLAVGAERGAKRLNTWSDYCVAQTFTPANARYDGRLVGDIALEEGKYPFDVMLDLACADDLETVFKVPFPPDGDEVWKRRAELFRDPRTLVGASDAGAHLDSLGTFDYTTNLLGVGVRERGLLTTEEAVQLLTGAPARLYGLRDRGVLAEGARGDVVVFDEATVGTEDLRIRRDLPTDAPRLYASSTGVEHVLVNGVPIVESGAFTDARPGTVLRAGRDTVTPTLAL